MGSAQPRAGRAALPLSIKLILATTILLSAAVGASGTFSLRTIFALAEREAASRRASGEAAIERQSELLARNAANSAALPLADLNFTYLETLVAQTVAEDPRIQWILIADAGSNRIMTRTGGAPQGDTLADDLIDKVLAAPSGKAVFMRDAKVSNRFIGGIRIAVGDKVVGQLRLSVSTAELEAELQRSVEQARDQAAESAREVLLIAAGILLLGILLGAVEGIRIARPLGALSAQAHRIAEGDLATRVQVSSRDEIGLLAADFNFMADRLRELLAQTASRAALEQEMSLARSVQESMIPSRALMEQGPMRVVGTCEPASICGGDWWTLRSLSNDRSLLAIGDVTGHGIPSAMVAATARGAVEAMVKIDEKTLSPEQVLRAIDGAIRGLGEQQLLMTCFIAIFDARRGTIEFSNAGHNFPYLLHTDPEHNVVDLAVLALRGSPLGNAPGEFTLRKGERKLAPGDVFVFFTDGVIDRVDVEGNRFGDRRLRGLLTGRRLEHGVGALRDEILATMSAFAGGAPADDDVTLVLCEYDPIAAAQRAIG